VVFLAKKIEKKDSKLESNKYTTYLIAIVAIVAIVGIISLSMGKRISTTDDSGLSINSENIAGDAKSSGLPSKNNNLLTSKKVEVLFNPAPITKSMVDKKPTVDAAPEKPETPEEPEMSEPVFPAGAFFVNHPEGLTPTGRFNLTNVGVLTQEFLDQHAGQAIAFNFSGEITLEDNLTFDNTIILATEGDSLTLNCQDHSITFGNTMGFNNAGIWVENTNVIQNCNIIANFGTSGNSNNRVGILLFDESVAEYCNV